MSGTVTLTATGQQPVTVKVGSSGTFSVTLPPGRYRASGTSPEITEVDGGKTRELPRSRPARAAVC